MLGKVKLSGPFLGNISFIFFLLGEGKKQGGLGRGGEGSRLYVDIMVRC